MAKKEKRKGGKSPKRITMSLKRKDDVWYVMLQYVVLSKPILREGVVTT